VPRKFRYSVYSVELKERVVRRILDGEKVSVLQRETGVPSRTCYAWVRAYSKRGMKGLRGPGKPRKDDRRASKSSPEGAAAARVAELERKIGQQALEIDFLQRAFKRVEESRQRNAESGVTASTGRSAR
jgi:transposase